MNYIVPSIVILIIPLLLSVLADIQFSAQMKINNFVLMNLFQAIWIFFTILYYIFPDPEASLYFYCLRYIGISFIPVFTLLHIYQILRNKQLAKHRMWLLCIIPAITSLLALTSPYHTLLFRDISFISHEAFQISVTYGPFFYIHMLFFFCMMIYTFIMLLRPYFMLPDDTKKSLWFLLFGLFIFIVTSFLNAFYFSASFYDISMVASSLSLVIFYFSLRVTKTASILVASKEKIYNNLQNIIFVLDLEGNILDYNKQALVHFSSIIEPPFTQYKFETFMAIWFQKENGRVSPYNKNIFILEKNFKEYHFLLYEQDVMEDYMPIGRFIEILEITEVYGIFRLLEESAYYDNLTGLHNRNSYILKIDEWAAGNFLPLSIIIGDVNLLKLTNDTHGHLVGDSLLKDIALILKENTPSKAFICRMGGDEFIIMMPHSSETELELTMEKISNHLEVHENPLYGSPSMAIGGILRTSVDDNILEMVRRADEAMYKNKHDRRGSTRQEFSRQILEREAYLKTEPKEPPKFHLETESKPEEEI